LTISSLKEISPSPKASSIDCGTTLD